MGVTLSMNKQSASRLIEWETTNERLIKTRFNSKYCKLTTIQCYAPANGSEYEVKEDWYEQLQVIVTTVPHHDILLVMGNMNAKVASDNTDREREVVEILTIMMEDW